MGDTSTLMDNIFGENLGKVRENSKVPSNAPETSAIRKSGQDRYVRLNYRKSFTDLTTVAN